MVAWMVPIYLAGMLLTGFAIALLRDVENDPLWVILWALVWPPFVPVALAVVLVVAFRLVLRR
jgi:hypothetical protein